jgi:hypothetical protein
VLRQWYRRSLGHDAGEAPPSHRGHFAQVPGTGSGTHWVGVASTSEPKPVVAALLPAVEAGDPRSPV